MLFNLGEQKKIQNQKTDKNFNTEAMLPISEIKSDTIILKDGWLRAILKVTGLNLDLKNYDEQQVILEQYKRFLNGLWFPIQILIRNTYLDLSNYISYVQKNVKRIEQWNLKDQWDQYLEFLDDIDSQQGLIYVKEFYIVVPYYTDEDDTSHINESRWKKLLNVLDSKDSVEKIVSRYRNFVKGNKNLETRINLIADGLGWMWIPVERLGVAKIINLLFRHYNPTSHSSQANMVK